MEACNRHQLDTGKFCNCRNECRLNFLYRMGGIPKMNSKISKAQALDLYMLPNDTMIIYEALGFSQLPNDKVIMYKNAKNLRTEDKLTRTENYIAHQFCLMENKF